MYQLKIRKAVYLWAIACGIFYVSLVAQGQTVSRHTAIVKVVERVGPAIVNISTEQLAQAPASPFFDEFFEEFFRHHRRKFKTHSLGSGIVVAPDGFIVTNEHVIRRASKITVIFESKKKFEARVIGIDSKNDIALLKVDAGEMLPAISWANSSDILIGETTIALGNPFGLQNSVTTGVVSASNRSLNINGRTDFHDFIQTDAAINPGNSGGALLNIYGQLIGVNTAIYAKGQGLGFAIPADRVREVIGNLLDYRKDRHLWLGVETEHAARQSDGWQVKITKVYNDSPADRARVRANELLVAIDNRPIHSVFEFKASIYSRKISDNVRLALRSGTGTRTVELTLMAPPTQSRYLTLWRSLGILPSAINGGVGVASVRPGSSADRIGMVAGDIIVAIAGYRIRSLDNLVTLLKRLDSGEVVTIVLLRSGRRLGGNIQVE